MIYQEGRNLTLSEKGDLILISYVKGEKGRKKLYIGYNTRNMNKITMEKTILIGRGLSISSFFV